MLFLNLVTIEQKDSRTWTQSDGIGIAKSLKFTCACRTTDCRQGDNGLHI